MKRKSLLILPLAIFLTPLASCGSEASSETSVSSEPIVSDSTSEMKSYTVTFETDGGSTVSPVTVEEGKTVSAPTDPKKTDFFFTGWYTDQALTDKASFPLTPDKDMTVYAGWMSAKDYFLQARENTVDAAGWSYNDTLDITTKLGAGTVAVNGPSAHRTGTVSYSSTGKIGYYAHYTSSGALLFDGQTHHIKAGTNLETIKQNEDGKVTSVDNETVASDYKYDSSTFAKAIFQYEDDEIKTVTEAGTNGYKLTTKMNASSVVKTILSNIDNPIVKNMIGYVPDTVSDVNMYVTFTDDGYIDTYKYAFDLDVTVAGQDQNISLDYSLDFDSYQDSTITAPTFDGVAVNKEQISEYAENANEVLNNYRVKTTSGYDYDLSTKVSYGLGSSKSLDVKGKTKRVISDGEVYFNNEVDVNPNNYLDSSNEELEDYKRTRGKIADGTVYDVEDPIIGFNKYTEVSGDTSDDEFYLLPDAAVFTASNFNLVQAENKSGETVTTFSFNAAGVKAMMDFVTSSVRLTPENTTKYEIFGTYETSSFNLKDYSLTLNSNAAGLVSLKIDISGDYTATVQELSGDASFDLSLTIETNNDGNGYTIPSEKEDLI